MNMRNGEVASSSSVSRNGLALGGPLQSRHNPSYRAQRTNPSSREAGGTRRSVSALAMPLSEVMPLDCRSSMVWARSAVRSLARAACASWPAFVRRVRAGHPYHHPAPHRASWVVIKDGISKRAHKRPTFPWISVSVRQTGPKGIDLPSQGPASAGRK